MSDEIPSPGPEGDGEPSNEGRETPEHKNKAVKAAKVASTLATQRLRRKRSTTSGGLLYRVLGGDNQLWNIMAMVVLILLFIMLCALGGAVYLEQKEFFLETAKPLSALIATIIAFIAGQKTGSSTRDH